ncbi:hypothetical protein [Nocardia brasiliensis]|uniref:hypothetical protein n=1 Tax=Nocardia brasiliensis TaxID=37326 RepID=UPI002455C077|nr:hypothetical protein [Nocardia brasiliensis]
MAFDTPEAARNYFGPHDDPQVIATTEQYKDVFSLAGWPDGLTSTLPGATLEINAPVLLVGGSQDRLGCNPATCRDAASLHAAEATHFAPAAALRTFVLEDGGDMIGLSRRAPEYHTAVLDWIESITDPAPSTKKQGE